MTADPARFANEGERSKFVAGRGRGGPVGGEDLDQALRVLGASI